MACLARDDKPGICDARVAVALPDRRKFCTSSGLPFLWALPFYSISGCSEFRASCR